MCGFLTQYSDRTLGSSGPSSSPKADGGRLDPCPTPPAARTPQVSAACPPTQPAGPRDSPTTLRRDCRGNLPEAPPAAAEPTWRARSAPGLLGPGVWASQSSLPIGPAARSGKTTLGKTGWGHRRRGAKPHWVQTPGLPDSRADPHGAPRPHRPRPCCAEAEGTGSEPAGGLCWRGCRGARRLGWLPEPCTDQSAASCSREARAAPPWPGQHAPYPPYPPSPPVPRALAHVNQPVRRYTAFCRNKISLKSGFLVLFL